jgi:hypothetical protein
VNPSAIELRAAYYCAADVIRTRQRAGQPIPQWLRQHFAHLDSLISSASQLGRESDAGGEQLDPDKLITAKEAADMLGCSKRQVQRLASDLDGQIVGGRWLFRQSSVTPYAEEGHQHGV